MIQQLQIIKWHNDTSKYFQYNTKISKLTWQLDNIIDEYYNNKLKKNITIQRERYIAKDIFSKFDSF